MAAGRPRKSDAEKVLTGKGKRPVEVVGGRLDQLLASPPPPPDDLGDIGKAWWNQVCRLFIGLGILDEKDLTLLWLAAAEFETVKHLVKAKAATAATGYTIKNKDEVKIADPTLRSFQMAANNLQRLCVSLGLSPADRRALEQIGGEDEKKTDSVATPPSTLPPPPSNVVAINGKRKAKGKG